MSKQIERGSAKINQEWVDNAPKGVHSIGDGLILKVKEKGGRLYPEYFARVQSDGKRRDIYLKSANRMKLRAAKPLATKVKEAVQSGENWEAVLGRKQPTKLDFTLKAVFDRFFATVEPNLKRGGDASRWWSQIRTHLLPVLGNEDVRKLTRHQMADAIRPLYCEREGVDRWGKAKTLPPAPETAKRALMRLKGALQFAAAETRDVDLAEINAVSELLGKPPKSQARIAATDWQDAPSLYHRLCDLEQTSARLALRLLILTAQRFGPIQYARVDDFDLENALWTIPHTDLKKPFTDAHGKPEDFRCPLSDEAVRVVEIAMRQSRGGYLFPGGHSAAMVSDVSLSKTLNKLGEAGRTHGMRSTFRGWAVNNGGGYEIVETALQHRVGGSVSQAYQREDFLDQRRALMERWAEYCVSAREAVGRGILRVVE